MRSPPAIAGVLFVVAGTGEVRHNKRMKEVVAVLHNIRSIHNVGSIFRTADGAGIRKLYLCGITPTPLDRFGKTRPDFQKVSLGAERSVSWEHTSTTGRAIKKLKREGYKIIAIEQTAGSVDCARYKSVNGRTALVIGNEVRGLTPSVIKESDVVLEIPMRGEKESLNVSVAFGIVAYQLTQ